MRAHFFKAIGALSLCGFAFTPAASNAASALTGYAIVTTDQTALRAAPRDSAAQQAVLWQGDVLEIRGQRMDHLQVYDHRRERAGFVLASQVRSTSAQPSEAAELLSVLRFVRDTPGAEALGIAYAAAYLKAVPIVALTPEAFDALGTLADRLARRASNKQSAAVSASVAAHLEVAAGYGVVMKSYEQNGSMQVCYDGDAFQRVLGMAAANPEQRARAALALTRPECVNPDLTPRARFEADQQRAEVLDRMDITALSETMKNRLRMRRAGVWSALAFAQTRKTEAAPAAAMSAAQRALQELAGVNKTELSDDDQTEYSVAAIRTGTSRWAAETLPIAKNGLAVHAVPGSPGETCVLLTDAKNGLDRPLLRRCTWGTAWMASASISPNGQALALAVQPLAGWRELWVLRRANEAWTIDVLPPTVGTPISGDIGYVEFAGWVPGGERILVAREARVEGRIKRSFEVLKVDGLVVEKQASTSSLLVLFGKWQDPAWRHQTVSLR
jgi:hypothetical protein